MIMTTRSLVVVTLMIIKTNPPPQATFATRNRPEDSVGHNPHRRWGKGSNWLDFFSPFLTGKFETTHCYVTWKASQAATEKNTKLQEPLVPKTVQVGQSTIKTLDINLLFLWQSHDSKITMQLSGGSAAACKTRGSGSVLHLSSQVIFNRQEMIFSCTKESLSIHNIFSVMKRLRCPRLPSPFPSRTSSARRNRTIKPKSFCNTNNLLDPDLEFSSYNIVLNFETKYS